MEKILQLLAHPSGSRNCSSVLKVRDSKTPAKKPRTSATKHGEDKENCQLSANSIGRSQKKPRGKERDNGSEDHDTDKELLDLEEGNEPRKARGDITVK